MAKRLFFFVVALILGLFAVVTYVATTNAYNAGYEAGKAGVPVTAVQAEKVVVRYDHIPVAQEIILVDNNHYNVITKGQEWQMCVDRALYVPNTGIARNSALVDVVVQDSVQDSALEAFNTPVPTNPAVPTVDSTPEPVVDNTPVPTVEVTPKPCDTCVVPTPPVVPPVVTEESCNNPGNIKGVGYCGTKHDPEFPNGNAPQFNAPVVGGDGTRGSSDSIATPKPKGKPAK